MRLRLIPLLLVIGIVLGGVAPAAAGDPTPRSEPYVFEIGRTPPGDFAPVQEAVIGNDTRKQVTRTTKSLPRRVVHILFDLDLAGTGRDGTYICSGALVAANVVATAAHCIFETDENVKATNVRVFPGRASRKSKPFGKCNGVEAAVEQDWVDATNTVSAAAQAVDYGAIRLDCSIGNTTGWFDLLPTDLSAGMQVKNNGYPGDKPLGTQWKATGSINSVSANRVAYNVDTFPGTSGGPIHNKALFGCTCIVAINTLEQTIGNVGIENSGTRVTDAMVDFYDTFLAG